MEWDLHTDCYQEQERERVNEAMGIGRRKSQYTYWLSLGNDDVKRVRREGS